ncbi:mRNA cap guanine-N7 methyltransferase [Vermiconidia calcicola]|uniref:mRNA cap guanine-N7 methyltransferase n=1 Tax=Vermiconidia calcicola TaxID=1690605 RepID=A0ACC3MM64_9PEZI|nr:mRNA cap guanine-N7 methyltransferase [Vermiconidia calcicola]
MPPAATDPPASNVTERRQPVKRKRETTRPSANSSRNTPNAYSRRSPPRERRSPPPREAANDDNEGDHSPPRKLKRPGAGARVNREAIEAARKRREEEEAKALSGKRAATTGVEQVANHYNAVPERGREWRRTDSAIKGLRSLNNWVKSTLIQKFSRPEIPVQQLCVLDMACGKGGDLGKWEKAPQVPSLYVGCDIAEVSIEQARERYAETLRRNQGRHRRGVQMRAEFHVQDTFGRPLAEIPTIRQVGFNPNAGPGGGIIQGGMMTGGFDVVSMMFALHYSFENEVLARGMLKNVAGSLKKGGRFLGVMPNSDVISAMVKKLLQKEAAGKTPSGESSATPEKSGEEEDGWDPEKPAEANGNAAAAAGEDGEDDWDPEKPSEPPPATAGNGTAAAEHTNDNEEENDDWDPEKPSEATADTVTQQPEQNGTIPATPAAATPAADSSLPPLEWGNALYTVRFPRHQPITNRPLPRDGIFRPPYGWRYHYKLAEAVDVPEYVVPWEGFRALAEDYGLELMYRKGFKEILDEIWEDDGGEGGAMNRELGMLAERMGVLSRDRSQGRQGLLVGEEEMEAVGFYHGFCFYKI